MGRGRWRGGQQVGGDGEGATGRGRRGSWQRGGAEEGVRGGGISHMKCLGGHMECLGGTRLQSFLTLFTRATPGTPASILIKSLTYSDYNSFVFVMINEKVYLANLLHKGELCL